MYISKVEVKNYKSYHEPTGLEFRPGFNIIIGKNSAGKTALLEALSLQFQSNPHRSSVTIPTRGIRPPIKSEVRITFVLNRDEFLAFLPGDERFLPLPDSGHAWDVLLEQILERPEFVISVSIERPLVGPAETWTLEDPTLGMYSAHASLGSQQDFIGFRYENGKFGNLRQFPGHSGHNMLLHIAQSLRHRIYRFSAERFNVGQCLFGDNTVLASNAQNLPEVLNGLQHNTQQLLHFNRLMREILPDIQQITVRPLPANQIEATVWPHDLEREDLAIPLNQCGSGIGQVAAILYVVMTSHHPQTIVVDEPQSFLHPGAIRKLIEVLKIYPKHQYILATHSPTVITSCEPATLTMVRLTEGQAVFQLMNPADAKDLQVYLAEIGARLADVFGADNILWVEGQTEEICFPLIVKKNLRRPLMGTAILGIRRVGDFERPDAGRIIDVYRRLSEGSALLPPAIAFLIDRECFTDIQQKELQKLGTQIIFLSRRMYENYLLNASAIATVLNQNDTSRAQPVTDIEVTRLIEEKSEELTESKPLQALAETKKQLRYFCPGTHETPADWKTTIDGAKVLCAIFNELTETRVSYQKTKHSVALTEWLIDHQPEELVEITETLGRLLEHDSSKRLES